MDFQMPLKDIVRQKAYFRPAPNSTSEPLLPLLEKQALVDEVLRGMPIRNFECYPEETPDGTIFFVTKGWVQLLALFDFADDQFPTWNATEREQWQHSKEK